MDDVIEKESEQTITISEYLKNVERQELEVDLFFGGDDGKECTYNKGYMKRQTIYSCLTCTPDGNAGVCLACSIACHDGHEVVGLWTRRNFKCDCGNSKFGVFFCKLVANKDPENTGNSYNHNFKGYFCTCGCPPPDQDAEEQVEMIQCCICEDWFHENHLGLESPDEIRRDDKDEPSYEDFICQACGVICSFLTLYPQTIWRPLRPSDARQCTSKESNVLGDAPSASSSCARVDSSIYSSKPSKSDPSLINTDIGKTSGEKDGSRRELSGKNLGGNASVHAPSICSSGKLENDSSSNCRRKDSSCELDKEASNEGELLAEMPMKTTDLNKYSQNPGVSSKCVLGVALLVAPLVLEKEKPMFLPNNWRDLLCRCDSCIEFYTHKGIAFLIDSEDSMIHYEQIAKQKREEKLQQQREGADEKFLNGLGHVQKMEILDGLADFKNELENFLVSSDPSKPITTTDVHQFFEKISKKRRRADKFYAGDFIQEYLLFFSILFPIRRDDKDEPSYEDFICQACGVICSFLTLYPQTIWAPLRPSDARQCTSKESNELGDAPSASSSCARVDSSIYSSKPSKSDPSLINTDIGKKSGEKDGSLRELSGKNLGGNASVHAPSICSSGKLENDSSSNCRRKDSSCELDKEASNEGELLAEMPMKTTDLNKYSQNPGVSSKCVLGVDLLVAPLVLEKEKPMFLPNNWRDLLCRCDSCIEFYTHKGIAFLIDSEDSMIHYEQIAKQKREEKLQQQREGADEKFLNGLGHVQKMKILDGLADFKNELENFLVSSDPSKPITTTDVHQFFEKISKKCRRIP
ncbi:uncharacterized protein LOC122061725 [Macadamia integrifolia]|uniref:uncharacterized protein LOC122061725 n=1 Tax=Macadamia integrifolia TaxID=60698 RepID=UPI001C52CFAA|nr:uncharacterized protein LOC122061725 [Macadamia integrifolia]